MTITATITNNQITGFTGDNTLPNTYTVPNTVTAIAATAFSASSTAKTRITGFTFQTNATFRVVPAGLFTGCTALTSVIFPITTSVTSIGASAFSSCTALNLINIPSGVNSIGNNAFTDTKITTITFPVGVTIISDFVSNVCTSLTSVIFLGNVTSIGISAFSGCTQLSLINIPSGVTSIGTSAFEKTKISTIMFPTGITTVPNTVAYLSSLTSLSFQGTSVTSIGTSSFSTCTELTSVEFGSIVKIIGSSSFQNCSKLRNIILPPSVTNIGTSAFSGCTTLSVVNMQRTNITNFTLGSNCFAGIGFDSVTKYESVVNMLKVGFSTSQLNTAGISVTITSVANANSSFLNLSADKKTVTSCTTYNVSGMIVYIPFLATSIGNSAFLNSTRPQNISIHSDVTSIGDSAFQGCTALTSVTLRRTSAQGLTTLGLNCFSGMGFSTTNFTSVTNMYSMGYTTAQLNTAGISTNILNKAIVDAFFVFDNPTTKTSVTGYNSPVNVTGIIPEIPNTVTSIGPNAFLICLTLSQIIIPASVTNIGANAFKGCTDLTSVTLQRTSAQGLTTLGLDCFLTTGFSTTNFTSVTNMYSMGYTRAQLTTAGISTDILDLVFPSLGIEITIVNNVVTSASYTSGPTSLSIPNTVTSIADNALTNLTVLTKITSVIIPSSVISIGNTAFQGCTALTSVTLQRTSSQGLTTLGPNCFSTMGFSTTNFTSVTNMYSMGYTTAQLNTAGISTDILNKAIVDAFFVFDNPTTKTSVTGYNSPVNVTGIIPEIPNTVTSIGPNAFLICLTLSQIIIPASVTNIGANAFKGCTALTAADIPSSVTSIGANAFQNCGFKSYSWPATLPNINDYTFDGCVALTTVSISSGVTNIGSNVFQGCTALTIADIPSSVTFIGNNTFERCGFITFIWPATLPNINDYTFAGCVALTSVSISSGVTNIGSFVFQGCTTLTIADIPASVSFIGNNTFERCGFIIFTWPNTVTTINDYMFADCIYLQTVKIIPTVPKTTFTLGKYVFKGCISLEF